MRWLATLLLLLTLGAVLEFTPDPEGEVSAMDGGNGYPPTPTPEP